MREQLRTGSCRGIALRGVTLGEKVLAVVLAIVSAVVVIALPNIL